MACRVFISILFVLLSPEIFSQYLHPKDAPDEKKFDFWIGQWDVDLKVRQADNTWKPEHKAVATIYPILDGKAILELWNENEQGILGYSLRYFNTEKKQWELWLNWPSPNRSSMSKLNGNFKDGRGDFFSEYALNNGSKRISRYTFSEITDSSLKWHDGYSKDNGNTWTGNWIMEFNRKADEAIPLSYKNKANTYYRGKRCNLTEFQEVNRLSGKYRSKNKAQSAEVIKVLDGCMVIGLLENEGEKSFFTLTYDAFSEAYELTFVNGEIGKPAIQLHGHTVGDFMVFNAKDGNDNASLVNNKGNLQLAIRYLSKDYNFKLQRR